MNTGYVQLTLIPHSVWFLHRVPDSLNRHVSVQQLWDGLEGCGQGVWSNTLVTCTGRRRPNCIPHYSKGHYHSPLHSRSPLLVH